MPSIRKLWVLIFTLVLGAFPLCAVTTSTDVRKALDQVASHAMSRMATRGSLSGAEYAALLNDPSVYGDLRNLRTKTRDYAIGSVLEATRSSNNRKQVLTKARSRVRKAGFPLRRNMNDAVESFEPFARIDFFPVDSPPLTADATASTTGSWIGARVSIGIPCGSDVSLYLWELQPSGTEDAPVNATLRYAREGALSRSGEGVDRQEFAIRWPEDGGAPEIASIETGAWCSSLWRTATMSVLRSGEHPYRPERLFQHQEPAFLDEGVLPTVARTAQGFRFRFLTHYWLNPNRPRRLKDLDVQVQSDRASITAPASEDPLLFLDQWVSTPWQESRTWTTGEHENALRTWHESLSPEAATKLEASVVARGNCGRDTNTVWVQLQTQPGSGLSAQQNNGIFGILKWQAGGFRVERIVEQLPSGCPLVSAERQ